MEFDWSEEQAELRAAVARLLAAQADLSKNRQLAESGERRDDQVWKTLAEQIGTHSLGIPEEYGGSGESLVELAIVVEQMARQLYGGPFFSSVAMAAQALLAIGDTGACDELLPSIADGSRTAAVAISEDQLSWFAEPEQVRLDDDGRLHGTKRLVLDGADADLVIVLAAGSSGPQWCVVESDAAGLNRTSLRTLDGTRPMGDLTFDKTPARPIGKPSTARQAMSRLRDVVATLLAVEQAGAAARITEITAEYAKTRYQFGRAIGSFQGVKHGLADMSVRHEMARSAAYWAIWQPPGTPEAALGARVARSYCSEAYLQNAKDAIVLHGGIGFTWEHDAHLFLRRARVDYSLIGDPAEYRRDLAPMIRNANQEEVA